MQIKAPPLYNPKFVANLLSAEYKGILTLLTKNKDKLAGGIDNLLTKVTGAMSALANVSNDSQPSHNSFAQ